MDGVNVEDLEGPCDKADSLPFQVVCKMLDKSERMRQEKKRGRAAVIISPTFIDKFEKQTIFPIMRLLMPNLDSRKYGMKRNTLGKAIIVAMGADAAQAHKILNYKQEERHFYGTIESVHSQYMGDIKNPHALTVKKVNDWLDGLAKIGEIQQNQNELFSDICNQTTSSQFKYIIRIICKEMNGVGFGRDPALDALHPDAVAQFATNLDFRLLCALTKDRSIRLTAEVKFGQNFRPMLCFRAPEINRCLRGFEDKPFYIEDKLDGERMMVHFDKANPQNTQLHSRGGGDYFTRHGYVAALVPYFQECIKVDKCILDGEVLHWDNETKKYVPFGTNKTVAAMCANLVSQGKDVDSRNEWLCFVAFDILYAESSSVPGIVQGSLTPLQFHKRRQILENAIAPIPHKLEIIDQRKIQSTDGKLRQREIESAIQKVVERRGEGLVLKCIDSAYVLDGRNQTDWVKLKPDYVDALNDSLDLIILGGYYGEGYARRSGVSSFLLGVVMNPEAKEPEFRTVGKVSSGLKVDELNSLRSLLEPDKKENVVPTWILDWNPKGDDVPKYYYDPPRIILSVKGSELQTSDKFSAGMTIRFPRIKSVREDKDLHGCMTFVDLQEMFNEKEGGMVRKPTKKRMRSTNEAKKRKRQEIETLTIANREAIHDYPKYSKLFENKRIFVLQFEDLTEPITVCTKNKAVKYEITSRAKLLGMLKANGAQVFDMLPKNIDVRIAPPGFLPQQNTASKRFLDSFKAQDGQDMVFFDWVVRCIENERYSDPVFKDYLIVSKETIQENKDFYDKYGDHLIQPAGFQNLFILLNNARKMLETGSTESRREQESKILDALLRHPDRPLLTPHSCLLGLMLYFDKYKEPKTDCSQEQSYHDNYAYSKLNSAESFAKLYCAKISDVFDESVTYVIADPQTSGRLEKFSSIRDNVRVVSFAWIYAVIDSGDFWGAKPPLDWLIRA
mmetsp:Transcript_30578/g.48990  ORF Transcript_30578/g.48990 Transcript_30578/m.48990 type:complete len:958 (-) Transcript_30578:123-2996(-)